MRDFLGASNERASLKGSPEGRGRDWSDLRRELAAENGRSRLSSEFGAEVTMR